MAVIMRWCQTLTLLATQCSRIEIELRPPATPSPYLTSQAALSRCVGQNSRMQSRLLATLWASTPCVISMLATACACTLSTRNIKMAVVTYAGALPVYPMEKFARQFAGVLRTAYL
jgi:hypothetical protein